jgi:hypothetical protein
MKHIRPDRLRVGDVFTTTDISPFATSARRLTWGRKHVLDMGCGTHTFIVCDRGAGLYYASEMQPRGLEMGEIQAYDHGPRSLLNHVCFVGRHPAFDDWSVRENANEYMKEMHSFGVKYGYAELLQWLSKHHPEQYPYRLICSQWNVLVFNHVEIANPFGEKTSPADWQRWSALKDITSEVVVA